MGIVKEKLPRILFIMHMPPPVHGAAMVGKYIHDSRLVNEAFDCRYINLATAANLEDIGKVRLAKFVDFSLFAPSHSQRIYDIPSRFGICYSQCRRRSFPQRFCRGADA